MEKKRAPAEQDTLLEAVHHQADEQMLKQGVLIQSHFSVSSTLPCDLAMDSRVRMIILRNIPNYFVEDNEVREWSWFDAHVSTKSILNAILNLVDLIEERLT